ncbi:MAG: hypothetical protein WB660_15320, partial [Candidatus Sulfotelmatobacter sp.]
IAAARRVSGAQLRALLRDGRDAALPSARTGKHLEAAIDPRGRDVARLAGNPLLAPRAASPEPRFVLYRVREHNITLPRFNVLQPMTALAMVCHFPHPD